MLPLYGLKVKPPICHARECVVETSTTAIGVYPLTAVAVMVNVVPELLAMLALVPVVCVFK